MAIWRSSFLLGFAVYSYWLLLSMTVTAKAKHSRTSNDTSNGVKVFGLGPGRSGTDSLRLALIRLGFGPSYHMKEILFEEAGISTSDHIELWHQLARNNNGEEQALTDLATMLDPWASGSDWPLIAFPKELLKTYPDAKFILTFRPAQKWYRSMSNTICNIAGHDNWYMPIVHKIPLFPFNRFKIQLSMLNAVTRYAFDGNDFGYMCDPNNAEATMKWYEDWNAKMVKIIPKKQLLVFETGKDSYEELASFLKVPIPEEPYPSSNSTRSMKFIILGMKIVACIAIMLSAFLVSMLLFGIRRLVVQRTNGIKID